MTLKKLLIDHLPRYMGISAAGRFEMEEVVR